jgi:hypothetical protein
MIHLFFIRVYTRNNQVFLPGQVVPVNLTKVYLEAFRSENPVVLVYTELNLMNFYRQVMRFRGIVSLKVKRMMSYLTLP